MSNDWSDEYRRGYIAGMRSCHAVIQDKHDQIKAQHERTARGWLGLTRRRHYELFAQCTVLTLVASTIYLRSKLIASFGKPVDEPSDSR